MNSELFKMKISCLFPCRAGSTKQGRSGIIVHPINPETREYIEAAVIGFYDNYVNALNEVISDFKMKA